MKHFELSARPSRWEYRDRQSIAVWAYEGQVPGPAIHVTEGDRVRVEFTNDLPEPTTVHWHGIDCHELHHADAGMMTLVQYDGMEPVGRQDDHGSAADEGAHGATGGDSGEH